MKRKGILGIWLVLFMLIMTACGSNEDVASGTILQSESDVQISETGVQESEDHVQGSESGAQQSESKASEDKAEVVESESEIQDESEVQDTSEALSGRGEAQGVLGAQEDASELQGESDTQEAEKQDLQTENSQTETSNNNLPAYGSNYYDLVNVVLYLEVYDELPPNYITKNEAQALGWEGGSVEKYKEGAAIGGDTFGNREGLLPKADGRKYTECDIDTHGYNSRGSRRLVFSNDGLYFYTSDHYENFSEVTVTEDYEVIW